MSKIPEKDLYAIQFEECYALYQEEKFTECIKAAKFNLSDPTVPRYIVIKTLILIANAEDDWEAAEECRVEAERLYQVTKQRISKQTQEQSNDEKEAMEELRNSLDITLASQVEDAPKHVRSRFSCWPPREGNIEDAIGAQEVKDDDDNDEQLEDAEGVAAAEQEMDEELMGGMQSGGHEDQESEKVPEKEAEGKQDPAQEAVQNASMTIAIRPKEDEKIESKPESKPEGKEGLLASPKSPGLVRKKSTKNLKQPPRWRF